MGIVVKARVEPNIGIHHNQEEVRLPLIHCLKVVLSVHKQENTETFSNRPLEEAREKVVVQRFCEEFEDFIDEVWTEPSPDLHDFEEEVEVKVDTLAPIIEKPHADGPHKAGNRHSYKDNTCRPEEIEITSVS